MNNKTYLVTLIGLALSHWGMPALAADAADAPDSGVQEVSDEELGNMRGRYTIDNNTVAYFGVSMISTWHSNTGQTLQSSLAINMNLSGKTPQITFVPTVTITAANAPLPVSGSAIASSVNRSVSGLGLANVGGMVQSVQVAGDDNLANNQTSLVISDSGSAAGNAPATSGGNQSPASSSVAGGNSTVVGNTTMPNHAAISSNGANASASYDNGLAQVALNITGEGNVRQWIENGSLGQTVQLTADDQTVSNLLQINLVRQAIAANTQISQSAAQSVAQAISLTRGITIH